MEDKKFNITLKELEKAVEFARDNGVSEHKTITMNIIDAQFTNIVHVSADWDSEPIDITDGDSF